MFTGFARILFVTAALWPWGGSIGDASGLPPPDAEAKISGTLMSFHLPKKTIRILGPAGEEVIFRFDGQTEFLRKGYRTFLSEIPLGDAVEIVYSVKGAVRLARIVNAQPSGWGTVGKSIIKSRSTVARPAR